MPAFEEVPHGVAAAHAAQSPVAARFFLLKMTGLRTFLRV
jgi:hypothetical protein